MRRATTPWLPSRRTCRSTRTPKAFVLPLYGERPIAFGDMGSETAAQPTRRTKSGRLNSATLTVSECELGFPDPQFQPRFQEVRSIGHRSVGPVSASRAKTIERPVHRQVDARRYGGAFTGATLAMMMGRVIPGFPAMGELGSVRSGIGSGVAAGIRGDARSGGRPGGWVAHVSAWFPAGGVPANTFLHPGRQAGAGTSIYRERRCPSPERRKTIDLIRRLNEANLPGEDAEFAARISAYDTAFKMQTEAPEVFDIKKESPETLAMYGVGEPKTDDYGRRCLLARRMVEKGVRFVCVVSGGGAADTEWDAHTDIESNHIRMASMTDKPVAGLIRDLKQRGLLDSTIVLWGGEFGRSPESEKSKGRDHHNTGFSMWVAGGGFKGGTMYGATDAIGLQGG